MKNVVRYDLKRFGLAEALYHIMFSITLSEKYRYKMLKSKDKYYSLLTENEIKKEILAYYIAVTGDRFDINNPQTFNQWMQWLKIYDNTQEKTILSDKYLVRDYVKDKIGEDYLIPLLGAWDHFDEIDFSMLPDSFCLKMNHGCAMNYIVKDKKMMDYAEGKHLFDLWEDLPFYTFSLELQYRNINRKVIAEQYIEELDGNLYDYKIHCFGGEPKIIQVIGNRDLAHHKGREAFFDTDWNRNNCMYSTYEQYENNLKRPNNLKEMLSIAQKLSSDFPYVRVDLYDINGRILFGEMTFTPASGLGKWKDSTAHYSVGEKIKNAVESSIM